LTFLLGDIELGTCDGFNIIILLDGDGIPCSSIPDGQVHCVEAHIYPDSICAPAPDWSGASIEVDASCNGDSITYIIQNVGTVPTTGILEWIVIEDDVILFNGNFDLDPSEVEIITILSNGSTYRLEAEQEANHPGLSMPSITVQGCGTNNPIYTYDFVNQFAQDDGNPFVDIECRSNMGSFDPNDKTGYPLGYGDEHYIHRGQEIEYLIRFQNTGTDTAFTVVILDTLSPYLDIATIRLGASSHPYTYDITSNGTLSFSFNNIMLPDSNVNEVASHGFVKFKIAQQAGLALETQIFNSAAIYFDFNPPVITNVTLHTIGEEFDIYVSVDENSITNNKISVFPNPFSDATTISIEGADIKNGVLNIYDASGRLLRKEHFQTDGNFKVERRGLPRGLYLFNIESNAEIIASGKIVIQ